MDMLNAPQQANESQQDYERRQNAAWQQANISGMPHRALSEVEIATSYHAGDDEAEELPEMRTPRRRVIIKEEEHEESVPEEPGESLIDDQRIVFEGREGVTPIDNMRQQFVVRTGNKDHESDHRQGRHNNNWGDRDHQGDCRPPGHRPNVPVTWAPQAPHPECRTEEPPYPATRAWSLSSPHDLHASTPRMNEAVKIHIDHMHDCLTWLVDDSLGVRFEFPDGVKPR
ncbi:hypothetical protein C0992_003286 [Termitomyces sp. T32_za158]|nr:hypothetical protein C0992_003286 [Termitomyces sp. T32_za158]